MNQRDTALTSLWGRNYRAAASRDPSQILDNGAVADAARLEAATDPRTDIDAGRALGWYRWLRYLALPDGEAEGELPAALALLKRVFDRNPYAVPAPLQTWYLQAEADSFSRSAGGRLPRGDRTATLPIFHAVVQSAAEAAPAAPRDRARFLLDAALMLRGTCGHSPDMALLAETAELTQAALGPGPATLPPRSDARASVTPHPLLESVRAGAQASRPAADRPGADRYGADGAYAGRYPSPPPFAHAFGEPAYSGPHAPSAEARPRSN